MVFISSDVCAGRVSKWLEEEPERKKRLREEKRKRLQQRRVQPKHFFDDQAYMQQLRANEEDMDDALKQGVCVCMYMRLLYSLIVYECPFFALYSWLLVSIS